MQRGVGREALLVQSGTEESREWAILGAVALCTMLAPLNSTMIVVALPRIVNGFGATVSEGGLLVTLYLIAMASCQPVAGKLGDRWGRRTMILAALLSFAVASAGAALAPSIAVLILFRVLQAICAGLALPNGVALVRQIVPAQRRASRFGLVGSASGVAAALGPPLGGVLTQTGGWRSIFVANIVLVVPALVIGWRSFPRPEASESRMRFDLAGAILLSIVLIGLAALLIRWAEQPIAVSMIWGAGAMVLLAAFLWHEVRTVDPVLNPRYFRSTTFASGTAGIALSNLAMYTTLLAIPLFEGERAHLQPIQVGLLLAAMSSTNLIASPLGGRLCDRYGRRMPTVAGLAITVPGLLPLVLLGGSLSVPVIAVSLAIAGFGFGVGWAGLQTAAIEAIAAREAGSASGVFSTARYFGSITGTSILAAVVGRGHGRHDFAPIFLMAVVAAAVSAVIALGLHDRPDS